MGAQRRENDPCSKLIANDEPQPGPLLPACSVPPWASTKAFAIDSPKRSPRCFRSSARSPCSKRRNRRVLTSSDIPIPLSVTVIVNCVLLGFAVAISMLPPSGVNFTALYSLRPGSSANDIQKDLLESRRISRK